MSKTSPSTSSPEIRDQIRVAMKDLVRKRGPDKTICPSTVAREVREEDWRPLLPIVREIAVQLVDEGQIQVTQRGEPVSPDASGPIRIGLSSTEGGEEYV